MRLRILTYNIHKCIGGLDRRYNPARISQVIEHYDPDFAFLQEVDHAAKRSNHDRQVDLLGDTLGFRYRSYFANVRLRRKSGGEYGNAILSRYPLLESNNIDLTVARKKSRSVLHARSRIQFDAVAGPTRSRTLHVYNLHLGLSQAERKIQLERFLRSAPFAGLHANTPVIVAGDFNDVWGTLGTQLLEPAGFRGMRAQLRTFPAYAPVRALDSIYVRGDVELEQVYRPRLELARAASDHLPLIADLRLS